MKLKDFDFRIWDEDSKRFYYRDDEYLALMVEIYNDDFSSIPKEQREFRAYYILESSSWERVIFLQILLYL